MFSQYFYFIQTKIEKNKDFSHERHLSLPPLSFSQLLWSINSLISYIKGKTFHKIECQIGLLCYGHIFLLWEKYRDSLWESFGKAETVNNTQLCFLFTAVLWTSYYTWVAVHKGFNKCKPRKLISHVLNSPTVIAYFCLLQGMLTHTHMSKQFSTSFNSYIYLGYIYWMATMSRACETLNLKCIKQKNSLYTNKLYNLLRKWVTRK